MQQSNSAGEPGTMSSNSPFKLSLGRDNNNGDEVSKELEKLDPQARKVAEGIRAFQSIARDRDSLQSSCASLTEQLKMTRETLERTETELEATQRERDHYLRMLSAFAAQSQILFDTATAMMAKINSMPDHPSDAAETATLASRLATAKAAE